MKLLMSKEAEQKVITDYWFEHYIDQHCTLCGNSGIIDTTGIKTAAGVEV